MLLIKAREGMSREAFKDYYETVHVPLALHLFPMIKKYKRNYVKDLKDVKHPESLSKMEFDVVTEIYFEGEAEYAAFLRRSADPDVSNVLRADRAKFIRKNAVFGFMVDEIRSQL